MKIMAAVICLATLACLAPVAMGQTMKKGDKAWTDLEKHLADVDIQWVCAYQYHKNHAQDCVDYKNSVWPADFFEISRQGEITPRQEMVKRQTRAASEKPISPGDNGPNPKHFELRAVEGNVALATDRTVFKAPESYPDGKIRVTDEATVLRIFVKRNGKWVPWAAALVPAKDAEWGK